MKSLSQIISSLILLAGILIAIQMFSPQTLAKVTDKLPPSLKEKINYLSFQGNQKISQVLGEKTSRDQIEQAAAKIVQSQSFQDAKEYTNKTVSQLIDRLSNLPEEQSQKVRKEVKRRICEEWLEE